MFEKLLQKLLKDVVGEFIDGIDTKKLNIGIWSGTVEIVNVSLKPRLLAILGLPYRITYSNISRLFITIPWKNLFTAPLVIQIESIQVLAENSSYQLSRQEEGKLVMLKIKQFIQKLGRQMATNKKTEQKSGGYLENVYLKMLDNLYLTIRNIHFRFQVSRPLKQEIEAAPFSFGITLQLIQLFAVDQKGTRMFVDRTKLKDDKNILYKKLKLQNFGFYWNYQQKQSILLSLQTQFPVKQSDERFLKDMLDFKQIMAGKSLSKEKPNYVILINAEGLVKEDNRGKAVSKITKYEVSFNVRQIKMVLNQKIIQEAVWFMKETSSFRVEKESLVAPEVLEKWEGPKNQNFLGLLRKYCISEFWQTDSGGKSTSPLSAPQQKILLDNLFENKQNLQVIQNKVKQIIMGDIGNKNAIQKSDLINNWQSIEALMTEQKKIEEGQLEVKFNFQMEQFCVFYVDDVKIPIVQLFIKGFQISADQNLEKGLNLEIQIVKLEGLGYDQNPIIRMEHQVETPFKDPKVMMKLPKLFSMAYKYREDIGQQIEIALGGIGFLYDFKTFRQLYRLPQKLLSTQPTPTPTSPPSLTATQRITQLQNLETRLERKLEPQPKRATSKQQKPLSSQITITIENVSVYILQYTKKTWRLSLSGCQLTNSESLVPENILVRAVSLSLSDFYVCEPFGAKIVLNLREAIPDISVLIQPIKVKINSETLKYLIKIPSCLQTYKKNDAISLSSKYGELCLLEQNQKWKKFDGVIIDGLLYLYEKNEEYSKYQFRVIEAARKQNNRRDVLQIMVRGGDKFILILRNQPQLEEWTKYLVELAEANRKSIAKEEQRLVPGKIEKEKVEEKVKEKEKEKERESGSKSGFNVCAMIEELNFYAFDTEKDEAPVIGLILRKAIIEVLPAPPVQKPEPHHEQPLQKHELQRKPSMRQRIKQSSAQQFKSFKQLKFNSKFSKKSREGHEDQFVSCIQSSVERVEEERPVQEKEKKEEVRVQQPIKIIIQVQDIEYWYKKQKRLYCLRPTQAQQIQAQSLPKTTKSLILELTQTTTQIQASISLTHKINFNYEPFEILQTMAYLNNRIFGVLSAESNKKGDQSKSVSQSQIKEEGMKVPANVKVMVVVKLQVKQGIEINLFNMLDYEKGEKDRDRVMRVGISELRLQIDQAGTRIQLTDISLQWFNPSKKPFPLVHSFGHKNRLTVQILNNKMIVKVYELFLPNYQHYIVMRAIDYLLVQVKEVLLYPYNFNQYFYCYVEVEGEKEKEKEKGVEKEKERVHHTRMFRFKEYVEKNMTKFQIWQRIKNLFAIEVQIYEGYIQLREQGYATIGFVRVTNSYFQSFNASIKDHVLCDQYLIELKDVNIWLVMDKDRRDGGSGPEKRQEFLNSQLQRQLSKKKQASKVQAPESKKQDQKQQRFFTVLNRFSNNLNEIQWRQRISSTIIQVISPEIPFDLSLKLTMFGKYPEYKSLYEKFQTSTLNTAMKIKLMLSELYINLLPNQAVGLMGLVQGVLGNLGDGDQRGFLYSYDQRNLRAVYREQVLSRDKNKPVIQGDESIVFPAPLHTLLTKDQYTHSPIQFTLQSKTSSLKILIPPYPSPSPTLTGLQLSISSLEILYSQFPITQTKLSFGSLDLIYLCQERKVKLVQFISAAERKSRETMFIQGAGMGRRDGASRPDLFRGQRGGGEGHLGESVGKMEEKEKSSTSNLLKQTEQRDIREAFSLKLYKKLNHKSLQTETQTSTMQAYEFNIYNIILSYDINIINFIFKLKQTIQQHQQKDKIQMAEKAEKKGQEGIQMGLAGEKKGESTEILCKLHHAMLQIPIPREQSREAQVSETNINYSKIHKYNETIFFVVKCALLTQLPQLMPIRVDVEHFQSYLQETCEELPEQSRSKSKAMQSQQKIQIHLANTPRNSSALPIKNKKKTLLQPTKLFYNKRISEQQIKVKPEKPKQEPQKLMSSRIKSILNLQTQADGVAQAGREREKEKEKERVRALVLLNQIMIGKCFVKISVQDLKLLGKLSTMLSEQVGTFFPTKIPKPQPPSSPKKPQKQPQPNKPANKKPSLQQKPQPQIEPAPMPLPTVNKIQFNPLELVIMNQSALSATPLIYSKLLINYFELDEIQVQVAANYFNLRINAWEPLIESALLLVKLEPHFSVEKISRFPDDHNRTSSKSHPSKKPNPNPPAQPQPLNKQHININISTNFLESLIPALQNNSNDQTQLRMSQAKSAGDEVNCWMLINQLGYDISCESRGFNRGKMATLINVPNNKTRKLTFLSDVFEGQGFQEVVNSENGDQEMISLTDGKSTRWTISIIINNQFRIKEIDIGEIGVKKFCFNYEGHPYWIYGHTYVDISKNVKYIKFYSQVMISNSTNLDLWVKLPGKEEHPEMKETEKPIAEDSSKKEDKIKKEAVLKKEEIIKQESESKSKKQRRYSYDHRLGDDKPLSSNQLQIKPRELQNRSEYIASDHQSQQNSLNEHLQTSFRKAHTARSNYVKIPANKDVSLPFDLDENFKRLGELEFAELISREPLHEQGELGMQGQDNMANSNAQSILKYQKFQVQKQRKKQRTIYKILPTGKLINKLPQQINLALKAQDHILYSYTLSQDQSQFIYTPFPLLQLSVHAKGFQWSGFMPCTVVENFGLLDFNLNKLNVKVNLFVDEDGIETIILYPIAVLYNDTDYDLHIRDPEGKNNSYSKVLPKKTVSLSNNRILVLKPNPPASIGFSAQHTNYTKVYMSQDEIVCKFELTSINSLNSLNSSLNKSNPERQPLHSPPTATESLLINQVSLRAGGTTNISSVINTKFVTISHQFYFSNRTDHVVLVRKYTGMEAGYRARLASFNVRVYQPNSLQSFLLFQQDSSTTKNTLTYYQLTLKNTPYEWSGALCLTTPGPTHFLLHNRSNYSDMLFLTLSIIKYHKIDKYKIELKEVSKEEVPYVVRNRWPGFVVKLVEFGGVVLRDGEDVGFCWDQPVLRGGVIHVLIGKIGEDGVDKVVYSKFQIRTENAQENQLIKFKKYSQIGQITITQNNATKYIEIRQHQKPQRQTQKLSCQLQLPLRIAVINNSFTPALHLLDFSTTLSLNLTSLPTSHILLLNLNLDSIQVDNQTRYRVYFPVVLSTSMNVQVRLGKMVEVEVGVKPVMLNVEEDFGRDLYAAALLVLALFEERKGIGEEISRLENQSQGSNKVLISKLTLPSVTINLQIKTKKLSIQTTITLQKPAITKYPWPSFPYPIKNIAITLLSHLSISPWALISSFQKGVVSLLTEQESSKGIEGFFGQIIAALSNSVNGLVGVLVGHDIERVQHFFDGIQQGSGLFVQQLGEIKDSFQPTECTVPSILAGLGYGLVSIVLKPMKGVLQMTLKISQGIKKTALFSFEDSQARFKQRDAIVFYGQQQKFRSYDPTQSQLLVLLLKIRGQPLKYFHLLKFFPIPDKESNRSSLLCIGTEQLLLIDTKKQKLIWQVNLHEVTKISIVRYTCVRLVPQDVEVELLSEEMAEEVCAMLGKVQKKMFVRA